MLQRSILIILSVFTLSVLIGCNKPNPHPETLDPIYSDLVKLQKDAEGQLAARKKDLETFEVEAKAAKPQTGQIKYAMKRVNETRAEINRLSQLVDYYGIKIDSRKEYAFKEYMRAFKEKKPWPDPKEYEEYLVQRRLEKASRTWSQKQQIEAQKANLSKKPAEGAGGGH